MYSVADPGFTKGEPIILAIFSQKLHKIEKKLDRDGGTRVRGDPHRSATVIVLYLWKYTLTLTLKAFTVNVLSVKCNRS